MGGCTDGRTYRYDDREKVRKEFAAACAQAKIEDGESYPGTIAAMYGIDKFIDKRFSTEQEAWDYIWKGHQKWSDAWAVSFYLPAEPGKRQEARKKKAAEKLKVADERLIALKKKQGAAFKARKSAFVACKGCKSKLAHDLIVKRTSLDYGHEPKCPLCNTSLLSETDIKRRAALTDKVKAVQADYDAASTPPPSEKIGWCVGGWCSS